MKGTRINPPDEQIILNISMMKSLNCIFGLFDQVVKVILNATFLNQSVSNNSKNILDNLCNSRQFF
jgi:hypothetical protein